ncbi:unnamed protein product [Cuscuta campestris]|uniref:Plasma membrane-associated cation-binding protein 1 n=2 Tax=Cuscuta sect. Cleistogrammica TaxID=1824901 RepID=A0A484K1Z9_9ASTE|nr:hypothetical protein DM860_002164 [Cuscuta australis]VFQ59851.1 unnamed protein product [Cuscuta campestris]
MNYWKSKVLPKIKKVFDTKGGAVKKAAAAEASSAFDDSKEQYAKELEEKRTELEPKVFEIFEASSAQIKILIKEPTKNIAGLKKNSAAVQKFLDELVKIDFPGSKPVSEASSKLGPAYVSGPVKFIFEKVAVLIPEEKKKENDGLPTEAKEDSGDAKAGEVVVEEGSKAVASPPVVESAPATEPAAAAAAEPPKVEEKQATVDEPTKA